MSLKVIDDGGVTGTGVDNFAADTNALAGSPTAFNATNGTTDYGQDVRATINGITATTKGTTASINTDFLDVSVDLSTTGATTLGSISAFTITSGGGNWAAAWTSPARSLGIGNVAVREIGKTIDGGTNYTLSDIGSGKLLNVVDGDRRSQDAVEQAIKDVSSLRGRLGA